MAIDSINGQSGTSVELTGEDIDGVVRKIGGKTGDVTLTVADIDGAAPKVNPAFTGDVTAPTPALEDSSGKVATTMFVKGVVSSVNNVKSVNQKTGDIVLEVTDIPGAAPTNSPSFSGEPTAPTAAATDNSNKLATTAHVKAAMIAKADKVSPNFEGNPTAPTPNPGTNNSSIATTAFVQTAIAAISGGGGGSSIVKYPTEDRSRVVVNYNQTSGDGWGVAHIQLAVATVSANGVTVGGTAKEYLMKVKHDNTTEIISTIKDEPSISGLFTVDNYANRTEFTYKSNVQGGTHLWSIKVVGIANVQLTSSTPTTGVTPTPSPTEARPNVPDQSLYAPITLNEAFDTSVLNSNIWSPRAYNGVNNPIQNFSVASGNLNIWPQQDSSGNWVDRHIDTDGKFYLTYGFVEIEAQCAVGKGIINEIMLMSHETAGEYKISLMEAYPGGGVNSGWSDALYNANNYIGGFHHWEVPYDDANFRKLRTYLDGYNISNGLHKYGIHWDSSGIQLYFDGLPLGPKINTNKLTTRAYLAIKLGYGSASGSPDGTTQQGIGNPFKINYVRAWPLATAENPAPTPIPTTKIVAYHGGSSIWGWDGDSGELGTRVSYPAPKVFDDNLPASPPYDVINEGVNGNTMNKLLNGLDGVHPQWSNYISNTAANIIIVNCAINDAYEAGNTVTQYKNNLRQIIDLTLAQNKIIILETPQETDDSAPDAYRQAMVEVAAERGISVIDQYTYLKNYRLTNNLTIYQMCPDGVHPNQATYTLKGQYAAQRFTQIMSAVVPTPAPTNGYIAPVGHSATQFPVMCFNEEFTGTSLNQSLWNTKLWYENDPGLNNYSVKNGVLNIWVQQPFILHNRTLDTDGKYEQLYGYFESEMKLPYGWAQWPAFWLYGHRDNSGNEFAGRPEIDFMEAYTGGGYNEGWSSNDGQWRPVNYAGTVHHPYNGYVDSYTIGATLYAGRINERPDLSAQFYVIGGLWDQQGVQFYFGGRPFGNKIPTGGFMNTYMYILLDLWLTDATHTTAGYPPDNRTPQSEDRAFQIKYVRAWKLANGATQIRGTYNMPQITYDPNATAPAPSPTPSPTPTTDPLPLGVQSSTVGDMSFRQDFNGSGLDSSYWYPSMPLESETQSTVPYENPDFSATNYRVVDGKLKVWPDTNSAGRFYRKTFSTEGKFFQKYGVFEMKARLPRGKGCRIIFGLHTLETASRPKILTLEAFSSGVTNGWATSDFQPNNYQGTVTLGNGTLLGSRKMTNFMSPRNLSDAPHVYSVVWDATGISFYIDGVKLGNTLTGHDATLRMFMTIGLWYGSESGPPSITETPRGESNSYEIEYVYAWKLANGTSQVSGTAPIYIPNTPAPAPAPAPAPSTNIFPFGQSQNYALTLNQEFSTTGAPDSTVWTDIMSFETDNPTVNYDVADGSLRIWPAIDATSQFVRRTLSTMGKFQQTYGFFEWDVDMPVGDGLRFVIGLFDHVNIRQISFEGYTGAPIGWWSNNSDQAIDFACQLYDGPTDTVLRQFRGSTYMSVPNLSANFNKLGIRWSAADIRFYLNGAQVGPTIENPGWNSPMYMLNGLWTANIETVPGAGTPTGSSNSLKVGYARAWTIQEAASTALSVGYYGDSTIWGYETNTGNRVANPAPTVFAQTLPNYGVVNWGVNGAHSEDAMVGSNGVPWQSWTSHMASSTATHVILQYHSHDSMANCTSRLRTLIQQAKATGKKVIVETVNPSNFSGNLTSAQVAQAQRDAATAEAVGVIDQHDYLTQYMSSNSLTVTDICPDGLHPTQAIYTLKGQYAATRFEVLK